MKKFWALNLAILITTSSVFAIEEIQEKKAWFSFFKKEKNEVKLEKTNKNKRVEVTEIELPAITSFKKNQQNFITMSIEECVKYAMIVDILNEE